MEIVKGRKALAVSVVAEAFAVKMAQKMR
jgi:hypothetical protein